MRSATVGVQFTQAADGHYSYAVYQDGNRNGVLTRDIQRGIDRPIARVERLTDQFPGVEFGAIPGLPPVDAGGTAPGADPIRLGSGSIASFSALGTATSGRSTSAAAATRSTPFASMARPGRTRMLKFEPGREDGNSYDGDAHERRGDQAPGRIRRPPHRLGMRPAGPPRAADRRVVPAAR